jgi:hypothetical protein
MYKQISGPRLHFSLGRKQYLNARNYWTADEVAFRGSGDNTLANFIKDCNNAIVGLEEHLALYAKVQAFSTNIKGLI